MISTHAWLRATGWPMVAAIVAGCAHDSGRTQPLPMEQRHISDFAPTMKDSPLDYRCGDCSFTGGIDGCRNLGSAPLIATVQRPVEVATERQCDASREDDFSARCRAKTRFKFERVQEVRGGSPAPDAEFLLEYEYAFVGGETPPAPPIGAAPRVIFAVPLDRQAAPGTDWTISAICPLPVRDK
jgi:hypothetical protein